MATYTKVKLSESYYFQPMFLDGTAGDATTWVHTTGASATVIDEVWLYLSANQNLSGHFDVRVGGIYTHFNVPITPADGLKLVIAGLCYTGTGGPVGTDIEVTARTGTDLTMSGYVNRITP